MSAKSHAESPLKSHNGETPTVVTTMLSTLKLAALFGMISSLKRSKTCEESGMVMNILAAGNDPLVNNTVLPASVPSIM